MKNYLHRKFAEDWQYPRDTERFKVRNTNAKVEPATSMGSMSLPTTFAGSEEPMMITPALPPASEKTGAWAQGYVQRCSEMCVSVDTLRGDY